MEYHDISSEDFKHLQNVVQKKCGLFLDPRKKDLVFLRLKKRLKISNPSDLRTYCDRLTMRGNEAELQELIDEITTQHTKFFRENTQLDYLQQTILPELQRQGQKHTRKKIRIWSAGCSSGEEPYTLAMILLEILGEAWDIRILASDICKKALQKAALGRYPESASADMPVHLVTQYFDREKQAKIPFIQAKDSLKNIIDFRQINFIDSRYPINTRFEIIFCRNVIIYFERTIWDALLSRFADYLQPEHGFLFLGHSEIIPNIPTLQKCKLNVFQKRDV